MISNIIMSLAGVGAFLIGFNLLAEYIEQLASAKLKNMFYRISDKKLIGCGIGLTVTMVIQSSAATSLILMGFLNSGMMTLGQAVPIVMGANIGTTITGQIAALSDFDFSQYLFLLTFLGVFVSLFVKNPKIKLWANIAASLGLVFLGLEIAKENMSFLKDIPVVVTALQSKNVIIYLVLGIVLSSLMQSSSAATSIIIVAVNSGIEIPSGNYLMFMVMGSNMGTCVPLIFSSIGAKTDAKRVAFFMFFFNFLGLVFFSLVLSLWPSFSSLTFERWFASQGTRVAMIHTFFNTFSTIILLPFTNIFVKISKFIVKDKPEVEVQLIHMDERLLGNSSIAIEQLHTETANMAKLSMENLMLAMDGFYNKNTEEKANVDSNNSKINLMSKQITDYLIKVSAENISIEDEKLISYLHHSLGDILRISEVADNITKYTAATVNQHLSFSDSVIVNLKEMTVCLSELFKKSLEVFTELDTSKLAALDLLEDKVDQMRRDLVDGHIARLNDKRCDPANSAVFINLVSNIERVGDHLTFLAHSTADLKIGKKYESSSAKSL